MKSMSSLEWQITAVVATLMSLRMLGLFLILPVLSLYTGQYQGATPLLMGWVIGIYGLTQACLQIPFGLISDHLGRKPVIVGGLLIFALGSAIAARADHITGLLLGRALQGAGAIGAAVLACLADFTRATIRPTAMAVVGLVIGLSFSLALLLGPILDEFWGLSGLFNLTAGAALVGVGVALRGIPAGGQAEGQRPQFGTGLGQVLKAANLWRLNLSIAILHAVFSALFLFIPQRMLALTGWPSTAMWRVYLIVLLGSLLLMVPMMRFSGRPGWLKPSLLAAIIGLAISVSLLTLCSHQPALWVGLLVFFAAFNFLEAHLPSLVAACAPPVLKGAAMGVYATLQFSGIFFGGVVGGVLLSRGIPWLGLGCGLLLLTWFGIFWFFEERGVDDGQRY